MRILDVVILACGIVGAMFWVVFSSKDGFKGSNAMIVARSISVTSTIDGQVDNNPPPVGAKVSSNDLLVRINNGRFDRSRLVEFESQIQFLESEITNVTTQQQELTALMTKFRKRAETYAAWMLKDVEFRMTVNTRRVNVAKMRRKLKAERVKRAQQLFRQKHTSVVSLHDAKTEAEIAENQLALSKAELKRSELLLGSLQRDGVFFENGDTSYWAKMGDTLKVRQFDNLNKISMLKAQLAQAKAQRKVESSRISSSVTEDHRAPFSGMVNASFVTKGTRVTSGTALFQILDCAQPIVIIPIPEHRISEFAVGMKVTVYPIDSKQALPGSIKYISSGPLIGQDKTIQIQQDLTVNGSRAIIGFDNHKTLSKPSQSCEAARKAVVVIHTKSLFDMASSWIAKDLPRLASSILKISDGAAQTGS